MRRNEGKAYRKLIAALIIGLWSSCAVEPEFSESAHIEASFGLKSPAAMGGRIAIEEAYLKLDRIEGIGSLSGQSNANVSHSVPADEPPYRLSQSDSSQASFTVTAYAYDLFDLHLYLFQDSYNLVFNGQEVDVEEPPIDEPTSGNDGGEAGGDAGSGNEDEDQGGQGDEDTDHDQGDNEGNGHGNDDDKNDDNADGNVGSNDDRSDDDSSGGGNDDSKDDGNDDSNDNGNDDSNDDGHNGGDEAGGKGDQEGDEGEGDDEGDNQGDKGNQGDKDKDDKGKDKGKNKDKGHKNEDHDKDHGGNDHHGDDEDDDDRDEYDDDDDHGKDDDRDDDRKSVQTSNQTVDLDHFFQNAKPAMVVFGRYENNGTVIKLIFVATGIEKFTLRARQNDSNKIILGENNKARITFDPDQWFQPLTPGQIESGQTQIYQQQTVLFIHPEHNTELYQALISGIEGSTDLIFNFSSVEGNL